MRQRILIISLTLLIVAGLTFYTFRYQWPGDRGPLVTVSDGDAQRGRQAILDYGCAGCHVIASVRQATGRVGPKLEDIREQIYLAGVLTNRPDNMIAWLMQPREVAPLTAMPDLEVSEQDARDIAAYLYQQGQRRRSAGANGMGH